MRHHPHKSSKSVGVVVVVELGQVGLVVQVEETQQSMMMMVVGSKKTYSKSDNLYLSIMMRRIYSIISLTKSMIGLSNKMMRNA